MGNNIYYAFAKDEPFVRGYFAKQILSNTDAEQQFWILGAKQLGFSPKLLNSDSVVLSNCLFRKREK